MGLRQDLQSQLTLISRRSYLLAQATARLLETNPKDLGLSLAASVNVLCTDGQPIPEDAIAMTEQQVREQLPVLNQFMTDVLLVELQALLHTHLMLAANNSLEDQAQQIESLLAKLWPAAARANREWAYRDVILLTEIRNAVMHRRGNVEVPNPRLRDAGWSDDELLAERRLRKRSFSDFLAFKRAVRTVANEALPDA